MIYFKVCFITRLSFFCFNPHFFFVSFWSFIASCVLIMAADILLFRSFVCFFPLGCFVSHFGRFASVSHHSAFLCCHLAVMCLFPLFWNFSSYCNFLFLHQFSLPALFSLIIFCITDSFTLPVLLLLCTCCQIWSCTSLCSTENLSLHTARKSVTARQGTAPKWPVVMLR